MSGNIADIGQEQFPAQVVERSRERLVLVDFWAPWCGPCRALMPVLEKVVAEYGDRCFLAKVNVDEQPSLAAQYGVRGVPAVKAFVDGGVVGEFAGALPEGRVREFIERHLPSPHRVRIEQARALIEAGEFAAARALLLPVVEDEPHNGEARVSLAECCLEAGEITEASQWLEPLRGDILDQPHTQSVLAAWRLAQQCQELPPCRTLEEQVEAHPERLEVRLDFARRLACEKRFEEALEQLLDILRKQPSFGDGAARKLMVEVFAILGDDNELVSTYRRRMASCLY